MNYCRVTAIAAVILSLSFGVALATTNQPISVSGNVVGDCTTVPASGSLAFGTYNPFSNADLAPSTPFQFSINCTRGDSNLTVAVDGGANYRNATLTGDRAMKDITGHYLTYQLYSDNGHSTVWGFSTSGGAGTPVNLTAGGVNSSNTVYLYGVIPQGQTAGTDTGSYSDTVHVTVNY